MKCPICGAANIDKARFCSSCGKTIPTSTVPTKPAVSEGATLRPCVSCGRGINPEFPICPYCGKDYRMPAPAGEPAAEAKAVTEPRKPLSSMLGVAALLMFLGGVFSLAGLAILNNDYFGAKAYMISSLEYMEMVVWATSAAVGIGGVYFILVQRDFGIAVTTGIFCIVAGFPIYYLGMIPGIAAVALLVYSRKEFP